jgi:predicted enzyme related to lactoylglutathione lyase
MKNQIVWVDIPVADLDRAIDFYSAVLGERVDRIDNNGVSVGVLPHATDQTGGYLFADEDYPPSEDGPLVYLNVDGRMDAAVLAADRHGGKIIEPQHGLGEQGWRTIIIDSEGNRIALHSRTA